jgi:hypothetical protein
VAARIGSALSQIRDHARIQTSSVITHRSILAGETISVTIDPGGISQETWSPREL